MDTNQNLHPQMSDKLSISNV